MSIQMKLTGRRAASQAFRAASRHIDAKTRALVRHHGHLLRTKVMAKASGRPGPNAPTGDYRRSWTVEFSGGSGTFTATAGTNAPQGRRLEHGFHGVDSLGRAYDQAPLPHAGPAFDEVVPEFEAGARKLLRGLLR
jgi:hypothetical protein